MWEAGGDLSGVPRPAGLALPPDVHAGRTLEPAIFYLTESVSVVLQKSIPAQIRQPIFYISNNK